MHGSCFEIRAWSYPVCKEAKFLGLIWDTKLTFEPLIKNLKARCQKSQNILKVLSRTEWGVDQTTLLKLYRSLVKSKLDYGCLVYGSASKTALAKLDPVHNQGLRLSLGAFRSSPVESMYVEAHEPLECLRIIWWYVYRRSIIVDTQMHWSRHR